MTYKIIGIMTGNSMDACDVVLTEFRGDKITDLCAYTKDFCDDMRHKMDFLRHKVNVDKIAMQDLLNLPEFDEIHDEYVSHVADCVNTLIEKNNLKKSDIDAIGFHGKTLDHNPPEYTLQIGSGQMLADLTQIPVIYDFRSDDIMQGGQGAPLVPPHNANIAKNFGFENAVFYNAGNTSNLAVVVNGTAVQGFDAGPFNEFNDKLVRVYKKEPCDFDGKYGKNGKLLQDLLNELFYKSATVDGQNFYLLPPPKSGDPAIYNFDFKIDDNNFCDVLQTSEYFSAYVAVYSLKYINKLPSDFVLFGGGWNNPVCKKAFDDLLSGKAFVLPEHKDDFDKILSRFEKKPTTVISDLGKYMEARLFADLARYYLINKNWTTPELTGCKKSVVLGIVRKPNQDAIDDKINRAAKGWQNKNR